jgi:hypothetical protein
MSKIESAMRLTLAYYAAVNNHDAPGILQFLSDNCRFEGAEPAPDGRFCSGKKEISNYWQDTFNDNPTLQFEIEEIFGLGLRCITCWKQNWEDASCKQHIRGATILRVEKDRISEILTYSKRD